MRIRVLQVLLKQWIVERPLLIVDGVKNGFAELLPYGSITNTDPVAYPNNNAGTILYSADTNYHVTMVSDQTGNTLSTAQPNIEGRL